MSHTICLACGGGFPDPAQTCPHCGHGNPKQPQHDPVTNPAHYRQGTMEVYDCITGMGLSYTEGAIVKYVARWRYKNGAEDLRKARWYLERLIEGAAHES